MEGRSLPWMVESCVRLAVFVLQPFHSLFFRLCRPSGNDDKIVKRFKHIELVIISRLH